LQSLVQGVKYNFTTEELSDRQIVKAIIRGTRSGEILQHLPPGLKYDKDIVTYAVGINGMSLQYAPNELKQDSALIKLAIQNSSAEYLCHLIHIQSPLVTEKLIRQSSRENPILIAECMPEIFQPNETILEALFDACYQTIYDDWEDQAEQQEENINTIIKQYEVYGMMPEEQIQAVLKRARQKKDAIDLTMDEEPVAAVEEGGRRSSFRHQRSLKKRSMKKSRRKRRKSKRKPPNSKRSF
jgi:hypothetical protein